MVFFQLVRVYQAEGRPNRKEQMLGMSAGKNENSSFDVEEFVISLDLLLPYIVDF